MGKCNHTEGQPDCPWCPSDFSTPTAEEREEETRAREYCKDWPTEVYGPNDLVVFYLAGSRDTKRQMLAGISEARELIAPWSKSHTECEDGFYSCPKAENYFGSGGTECDCGKDDLASALAILERLAKGGGDAKE